MPDSLVANWLVRPLATIGVVTVSGSATIPITTSSTTTTSPAPSPSPANRPMKIGNNLAYPNYYSGTRAFMNLAAGSGWTLVSPTSGWIGMPADHLNPDKTFKLNAGESAARMLSTPTAVLVGKSADIVCRWQGTGTVSMVWDKINKNASFGDHVMRFTWVPDKGQYVVLTIANMNSADPIRNLDCREADASQTQLFDPTFLANVKKYNVLRFMDWQSTNGNKPATWATRLTPDSAVYMSDSGVAIEYMIELANQTKTNPWFTIPWNADDDYIRRFAEMVRDRLDPSLTVYVELSNEVWNYMFPVTAQAEQEGLAEGLHTNKYQAVLYRYAEKSGHALDIWKDVFAGQSSRLVRVVATQNSDWNAQQILNFRDTASKVDAIATAPYFDYDNNAYPINPNNLEKFFSDMKAKIDDRLGMAIKVKAQATSRGKRYITYEAGQHATGGNVDNLKLVQRDKRMGQLYKYYLTRWQQEIGDDINLYADVGGISQYGAWGLQEYLGQPLSEAPKAQTVNLFVASINNK